MIFLKLIFFSVFLFLLTNLLFFKLNIIDFPNNKLKKHKKPVTYNGGFVIFLNILLIFFYIENVNLFFEKNKFIFFIFLSLIFLVGFFDDILKLSPILRTGLLILIFFYFFNEFDYLKITYLNLDFFAKNRIYLSNAALVFTIFCIFSFVQSSNMMDGINGQFAIYFLFLILYANLLSYNFTAYLVPALLVFLYFNYKNLSFLGDGGSYLISFLVGIVFIKFHYTKIISADEILCIMLIPGLEMIRLFFLRFLKGKNPLKGDRKHIHHLLEQKYGNVKGQIISPCLFVFPIIMQIFDISTKFTFFLISFVYLIFILYLHKN